MRTCILSAPLERPGGDEVPAGDSCIYLKPSSVRYIHAVLHRALSKAVELRLIARNPAANADPPKVHHEEITPLDDDQARVFLDAARGQKHEALYVLSRTCGLRMGESLGLKWSDIDLEAGTLRVNRQLQRLRKDGDRSGRLVFSEPKNASRRTIDLPQRTLETLRSHRKNQLEQLLRASAYEDSDLVLATRKGTPLDAQNNALELAAVGATEGHTRRDRVPLGRDVLYGEPKVRERLREGGSCVHRATRFNIIAIRCETLITVSRLV